MKKIFAGTDKNISEREKRNGILAHEIASEGIVLLKNDGVLPLTTNKIALFGSGARKTLKGGTGSGSVNERHSVSIEEGLLNCGYEITTGNWLDRCDANYNKQHSDWRSAREKEIEGLTDIIQILTKVNETPFVYPTGVLITDEDIATADTNVAIYVVSRQAGEGYDRTTAKGDFLLDDIEYANIKKLTESFSDTIVVVNAGGQVNTTQMEQLGVKGIVFYGQAGQEGGKAFADVVSGKVSPSGKLTATWVKNYSDIPFGDKYGVMGNVREQDYQEDIYVGYRYYDTFGVTPAYPFGFGLSYTEFAMGGCTVDLKGNQITVKGTIKNVGSYAGKEIVQIYVELPYGADGAEAKRLVGFYKTPLLQVGKKCSFAISFDANALSRYVESKAAFVLVKGDYRIRVGNSSANTVEVCSVCVETDVTVEQCRNICPTRSSITTLKAPMRYNAKPSKKQIVIDAIDVATQTHCYEQQDVIASDEVESLINQMSISELAQLVVGGGVMEGEIVTALGASGYTTGKLYEKYGIPNLVLADGPAGLNVASEFAVSGDGRIMALAIPPAYDFGMFGQFMRANIAQTVQNGIVHYQYATAMPSSQILAQTWNLQLGERLGKAMGDEMQEMGVSVWLAPGMNIQRNPLCGRNFEYYSEDPVVSGKMAAAVTRGVQSVEGKTVSIKHFCCNNVEYDRSYSSSNLTERALREIYLKGFRIAVEEGNPLTVMSSYNKINGVYSPNNRDLLVDVLRGEWNYKGMVMTDWSSCGEGKADTVKAIAAENDLVMPGTDVETQQIVEAIENGELTVEQLRRSAKRVLELVYKTTAIPFEKR